MERFIGCSGWHYKDWKERFYPEGMPQKDRLGYYSEVFSSVEVNATFYKVPKAETFRKWDEETPSDFRFSLKGSRYVTHLKKLKEVGPYVKDFYDRIAPLGDKVGCVLWQLPGNFKKTGKAWDKLDAFVKELPGSIPNVLEFRDPSWFDQETRDLLASHRVIPCSVSSSFDVPELLQVCEESAYIRFHGKGKELYKYFYAEEELREWADALMDQGVEKVFAYFNNDYYANGPMNAKSFLSLLSEERERRA
jgi:uncharacterized protein YecE (DUF72 family)